MAAAASNSGHEEHDPSASYEVYLKHEKPPMPSVEILTQYYKALLEKNQSPIEIIVDPETKQKSVYATRRIEQGETVLTNEPWMSMRHRTSQERIDSCERCHRILGDAESQIRKLTTVRAPSAQEGENTPHSVSLLDEDFKFPVDLLQDPEMLEFCSSQCSCQFGCGTLYCSVECRGKAWKEYHRQLCPNAYNLSEEEVTSTLLFGSSLEHDHSVETDQHIPNGVDPQLTSLNLVSLFNRQAEANNEIFKLAAKIYANILSRWRDNGNDMEQAMLPLLAFHQRPWWEVVVQAMNPADKEDRDFDPEEVVSSVRESMLESLHILHSILISSAPSDLPVPEEEQKLKLFNLDTFANLIGAFELNNISVEIDNPLRDLLMCAYVVQQKQGKSSRVLLDALRSIALAEKARSFLDDEEEDDDDEDEEDDGSPSSDEDDEEDHRHETTTDVDTAIAWAKERVTLPEELNAHTIAEVVPHCDGTCIMPITCCINHSCIPNSSVSYSAGSREAFVQAVKPISSGEEVLICYVDEHGTYEQRCNELRHYDFECQCKRCQKQE